MIRVAFNMHSAETNLAADEWTVFVQMRVCVCLDKSQFKLSGISQGVYMYCIIYYLSATKNSL